MFKKLVAFAIIFSAVVLGIYYLPDLWRKKGLALFYESPLVPNLIKDSVSGIESLLSNPIEERRSLIEKLENDLGQIKETIQNGETARASPEILAIIQSSELALSEMKAKNEDQPLVNIVAEKIAAAVVNSVKESNNGSDAENNKCP